VSMATSALMSVEEYTSSQSTRTCGPASKYFAFGIPFVWVINPRTRRGHVYSPTGMQEAKDRILRATNPDIEVPLSAVFRD
jgi:Uma2 family endonuclease